MYILRFIILACMASPCVAGSVPVEARDDRGHVVQLSGFAERIVSLAPHITELLYEAGAGDRIVGTVEFSDYPDSANKITRIGSFNKFDFEAIVALKPDLIIAWHSGNPDDEMRAIHQLDMPIFYSEPKSLADIAHTIERLGRLTGTMKIARQQADQFLEELSDLKEIYKHRSPVSVFYEVWDEPLMTVNGEHIISDAIALCGGVNVFAEMPVEAPSVDIESLLSKNPQVIIAGINGERGDWLQKWKHWPDLDAVKNGHVYGVNPDLMTRHTSRILTGTRQVCDFIEKAR